MAYNLVIATGTRADWGLLRPLAEELKQRDIPLAVWATNMHAEDSFGNSLQEITADGFQPLLIGKYKTSPEEMLSENIMAFAEALRKEKPSGIIILGDRIEMLGVASAALMTGVPIIHIAGGTVSEGAVDDAIRNAISQMASLHLTETDNTGRRLRQRVGNPERVHVCGALGVYNALRRRLMTREELEEALDFKIGGALLVGTLHAATIPGPGEEPLAAMNSFLTALGHWLGESTDNHLILTWPNNDVDPKPQVEAMEWFAARFPGRVLVIPSLGALRYLSAVALSVGVVGNSSSGLVEVPSLGVPTLDIGSRQKGRECGESVIHSAPDAVSIKRGIDTLLSQRMQSIAARAVNPYERPDSPALMASHIIKFFSID